VKALIGGVGYILQNKKKPQGHQQRAKTMRLDTVKSKYFGLEEQVARLDTDAADKVIRWWLNKLNSITGHFRMMSLVEFQSDMTVRHAIKEEIIELD